MTTIENKLPNEVMDGNDMEYSHLRENFSEVFGALEQSDLRERIQRTHNGFQPRDEYFDRLLDRSCVGEWQRPTQLYHFDIGKFVGTLERKTHLLSKTHFDESDLMDDDHYVVTFHFDETLHLRYAPKTEISSSTTEQKAMSYLKRLFHIRSAPKTELPSVTTEPKIYDSWIHLPTISQDERYRYPKPNEGNNKGLNFPMIPITTIRHLKDVKIEGVDGTNLKITVGMENPLEYVIDLEKPGQII